MVSQVMMSLYIHMTSLFPIVQGSLLGRLADPSPEAQQFYNEIEGFLGNIQGWLIGLGVTIFVIGVVVGGLMRATAFGSERRIAASNAALSCAVIGFIIVLIAIPLSGMLEGLFP